MKTHHASPKRVRHYAKKGELIRASCGTDVPAERIATTLKAIDCRRCLSMPLPVTEPNEDDWDYGRIECLFI